MAAIINFILKILFFIVFWVIVTPLGVLLRLAGIDYLQRQFDSKKSYWINKEKS